MPDFNLITPVVFIIFNRPDHTERVFKEIAKAKPAKLLVIADGPRANIAGEVDKVLATREVISQINWDCELLTNYSNENLGCKSRVSSGIDWAFQNVEEAIILEDDCLPAATFFRFCQEMLDRYRLDSRIGMVSGDNFQFGSRRNNDSYYFSKYAHIWGWATWRDRWQGSYDVDLEKWPVINNEGWLLDMLGNRDEADFWGEIFEKVYAKKLDSCWDYQWMFANLLEGRLNVMPNVNLISNVGFGEEATHTFKDSYLANIPTKELNFPLNHPIGIIRNWEADYFTYLQSLNKPIYKKAINKLVGYFKGMYN